MKKASDEHLSTKKLRENIENEWHVSSRASFSLCIVVHVFPLCMCESIREGGELVGTGLTC